MYLKGCGVSLYTVCCVDVSSNIDLHGVLHLMYSHFAVVDCGSLTDPANGRVDHTAGTPFGQTATYSCNTGYNLVGDSTLTCQASGNWSGSAPTCLGILLINIIYHVRT